MKQKIVTGILIFIIIVLLVVVVLGSRNKRQLPVPVNRDIANSSFFYGNSCPHCKDVETWMAENKIEEKIKIVNKEVYENKENALELSKAAGHCGLPTDTIIVPFLYTPEGKCLIGVPDIMNYLSQKAGL